MRVRLIVEYDSEGYEGGASEVCAQERQAWVNGEVTLADFAGAEVEYSVWVEKAE